MNNNDALREALRRIKALVTGDARPNWDPDWRTTSTRGVIADLCDEALAASKPEPQAQAGEPEVVAYANPYGGYLSAKYICDFATGLEKQTHTTPLVTLQAHREAMAKLERERDHYQDQWSDVCNENQGLLNAIAKKDAALKALAEQGATAEKQALEVINRLHGEAAEMRAALKVCVEALERVIHALHEIHHAKTRPDWFTNGEPAAFQHQRLWESRLNDDVKEAVSAAIQQAQEAQK